MAINIKYRPLKAFLLASESGSFTHAADRLGVTQPSFTALIQDLEEIVGVRLFDRTTRSVALTAAGEEFLARIERPVSDLEDAYRSILDLAAVRRGSVVLGALPSAALTLIPPALRGLREAHPTLHVRVVEAHNDELFALVRTNQVEFALATMPDPAADLAFEPIVDDVVMAVFPADHELAGRPRLRWRDVIPYDLILLSKGSNMRDRFDRIVQSEMAAPAASSRYDVTHMTTATGLVRQGLGITLLPLLALPELNLTGLLARPLEDESARRRIGIMRRADRSLSSAAQAFAVQLARTARDAADTLDEFARGARQLGGTTRGGPSRSGAARSRRRRRPAEA
jgi:LysR family transcriptional regulator, carnitine catabolism transcriptional activator